MLSPESRRIVELVKEARELHICIPGEDGITVRFSNQRKNIKKLAHDIALAMQDYRNVKR